MRTPTHLLIHSATRMIRTTSLDSGRSPVHSYTAGVTFKCRIQTGGSREDWMDGAERTTHAAKLYCSPSVVLAQGDCIVTAGRTWEIVNLDLSDDLNVLQRAVLEART